MLIAYAAGLAVVVVVVWAIRVAVMERTTRARFDLQDAARMLNGTFEETGVWRRR